MRTFRCNNSGYESRSYAIYYKGKYAGHQEYYYTDRYANNYYLGHEESHYASWFTGQ